MSMDTHLESVYATELREALTVFGLPVEIIGIGGADSDRAWLVYVETRPSAKALLIPERFRGLPVRIIEIGKIQPAAGRG